MALPRYAALPQFTTTLPSTGQEVVFRPFTAKEEKLLLIAAEAKDLGSVARSVKQVIGACLQDPAPNIDKLPFFDLEYLFLKLRSKSVGEVAELGYRHAGGKNKAGEPCEATTVLKINLDEVPPPVVDPSATTIKVSEALAMVMRYPTLDMMVKLSKEKGEDDVTTQSTAAFDLMAMCLESVVDGQTVHYPDSLKDSTEFIDGLPGTAVKDLVGFFQQLPTVKMDVPYTCEKCKETTTITLQGIRDFF